MGFGRSDTAIFRGGRYVPSPWRTSTLSEKCSEGAQGGTRVRTPSLLRSGRAFARALKDRFRLLNKRSSERRRAVLSCWTCSHLLAATFRPGGGALRDGGLRGGDTRPVLGSEASERKKKRAGLSDLLTDHRLTTQGRDREGVRRFAERALVSERRTGTRRNSERREKRQRFARAKRGAKS